MTVLLIFLIDNREKNRMQAQQYKTRANVEKNAPSLIRTNIVDNVS